MPATGIDEITGKQQGWIEVSKDNSSDKYHIEAFELGLSFMGETETDPQEFQNGTYELIGPKIQGNPEKAKRHILVRHGAFTLNSAPRDFSSIKNYLATHDYEGIVWHRDNGDMVKIKTKDFFKGGKNG